MWLPCPLVTARRHSASHMVYARIRILSYVADMSPPSQLHRHNGQRMGIAVGGETGSTYVIASPMLGVFWPSKHPDVDIQG